MKKQIRQVTGTSVGITFTKEEQIAHELKVGDVLDMADVFKIKTKGSKK
jgi:hypothetical protein